MKNQKIKKKTIQTCEKERHLFQRFDPVFRQFQSFKVAIALS